MTSTIFLGLEPFEMKGKDIRKTLDLHALFGFLKVTAGVAEELISVTQHFTGAKLAQASGDAGVLLDVDREI